MTTSTAPLQAGAESWTAWAQAGGLKLVEEAEPHLQAVIIDLQRALTQDSFHAKRMYLIHFLTAWAIVGSVHLRRKILHLLFLSIPHEHILQIIDIVAQVIRVHVASLR